MATNKNFVVQNGLQVGPLTIFAGNGDVYTSGNINSQASSATFESLNNTPIGNGAPSTGNFTTVTTGSVQGVIGNITPSSANFTSVNASNLYASTIGNVGAMIYGTVETAAQPNITSLGALTALTVAGTATAQSFQGVIGNITPASAFFTTANASTVNAATIGNVGTTLYGNAILSNLSVSGASTFGTIAAGAFQGIIGNVTPNLGSFTIVTASNVYATTIGNAVTNLYGVVQNSSQPLITNLNTVTAASLQGVIGNVNPTNAFFTTANASTVNAATIGNVGTTLYGTIQTPSQTNITSVGTLSELTVNSSGTVILNNGTNNNGLNYSSGALQVQGGAGFGGNLYVGGNLFVGGNINLNLGAATITNITGNVGQFFGNASGFGALFAGIATGYVFQSQTVSQNSTNFNGYAQVNHQNINGGPSASTDYVATMDTGTASTGFIDMGINSSGWNGVASGQTQSYAGDGYLIVQANTTGSLGNLLVGTAGATGNIFFVTGGQNNNNLVMSVTTANTVQITSSVPSTSVSSGALQVSGGMGVGGNLYVGGNFTVQGTTTTVNTEIVTTTEYANVISVSYLVGNSSVNSGNIIVNNSSQVLIANTSATTSASTGALQVKGGVGIGGALNVSSSGSFGTTLSVNGMVISRPGNGGNQVMGISAGTQLIVGGSGNYNTLYGATAGVLISSGNFNVAVGNSAGSGITSGPNNIAIGFSALGTNTYGSTTGAIGIGYGAMQNGMGNYSIGVGQNSLNNAYGVQNIAVGYNAGSSITLNSNIAIFGGNIGSTAGNNTVIISDGAGNTVFSANGATLATTIPGSLTVLGAFSVPAGSVTNSELANNSVTVSAGTGISGGGTVALGGTITVTNAGVTSLTSGGHITASASTGGITLGSDATSANTAGTIVARDGSGNFSGGTFTGTATQANYADVAENYQADTVYHPGTVLMFGGDQEVTVADPDTIRVAGVVSTNPAHLMNTGLQGAHVVALALLGRVPCNIVGPVRKGDLLVSAGFGYAKTNNTPGFGQVIGKALEDFTTTGKGVIEVVVGRI